MQVTIDIATCIFYTGIDPFTKKRVDVARDVRDPKMQRALMQFFKSANWFNLREALIQEGRQYLDGTSPFGRHTMNPRRMSWATLSLIPLKQQNPGNQPTRPLRTGRRRSGPAAFCTLPALFLLLDAAMKLVKPGFVVEATADVGFPESVIVPLGIVLAGRTILDLIPRTAALGAILLTGYLGGVIAAHVRHEDGWFPIVFCVVFGALLWSGLLLRDARLRAVLPWNR
jgi:hypothetical protein